MSFKEIGQLRKAGKLEEAHKMASEALLLEPGNIWNKRAASWVYYEYLKANASPEGFEIFLANLKALKELELPADEDMVFDQVAWKVGSMVFALHGEKTVNYGKISKIFNCIRSFHFTKPSEGYSFLFKAFQKGKNDWPQYMSFVEWWGLNNLREEDYQKEEYNGKRIMALAEQAYIAYSKKLLTGEAVNSFGSTKVNRDKVEVFFPLLDQVIEDHPEYQYPAYFKAKLLLATGEGEDALETFLPFAKLKKNDFWVWELMAEILPEEDDIQFACYCKALSLKSPEGFILKMRQTFAGMLIERELYDEARTEIEQVVATRKKNKWKIPGPVTEWINKDWYKSAEAKKSNKSIYLQHLQQAEDVLFRDVPEEIVVVEFVNENKSMLNFVKDHTKYGFFNYSRQLIKPQIGDILKVRFSKEGSEGFFKALSVEKLPAETATDALKPFGGTFRSRENQSFGFVDKVFVDPGTIKRNGLVDGQEVVGDAILSWNKKKESWGWKVVKINLSRSGVI
ncbi:tetratricopeptide repeat protein [Neolewinella antarctica]|uniref:Tetratricopeptide (TPR) repeat protein n=1 Tax=Neolewinella antarctica TaxID=442734 RepID=A0ABX0XDQ9_9BACT|nr:tetratricopeptide repeat protein [Neolewinella antarctica]NJC27029.1 tetratricopeptide (TPR) repeat protein [Neolewinella antarctica]